VIDAVNDERRLREQQPAEKHQAGGAAARGAEPREQLQWGFVERSGHSANESAQEDLGSLAGSTWSRQSVYAQNSSSREKRNARRHGADRAAYRDSAPSRSVTGLGGLALDVTVDPPDYEIGQLVAISVLHQHVAIAFDAERRQVHHLRVAAGFL
jgi:hypothetical protein